MRPVARARGAAWLGIVGLACGSVAAGAQVVTPPPGNTQEAALAKAVAYSKTEAYKKLVAQAMARVPASVAPRCARFGTSLGAFDIAQPLQIAAGASPTGGAWHQAVTTQGCGDEVTLNFYFFANLDGRVSTVVGVPGTTRADLVQQRDARTYALLALAPSAAGCGHFETLSTRFEGYGSKLPPVADPGPDAPFRPWWESWTLQGCGKRYEVPLNFMPNRLGTQIVQPGGIVPR
jgi:hypothetical protein